MHLIPGRTLLRTATLLVLAGCGSSGGTGTTEPPGSSVASVVIVPAQVTLGTGGSAELVAVARDGEGDVVSDAAISWQSDSPAVATVAADGTVTGVSGGVTTVRALSNGHAGSATITVEDLYDLDGLGPPELIEADYLDLSAIARISRFRSGFGHDYADDLETCRSMKHYFQPRGEVDWSAIEIVSPIAGRVIELMPEQTAGTQVRIRSAAVPAATVYIFHVAPDAGLAAGQEVAAGERLGTHIGDVTLSDVAIWLMTPTGRRAISYFDAMPDSRFAGYVARGVADRGALIIGRAERDAAPLQCDGEAFLGPGSLENWVELN
jgi:hypothetical protein